MNIEEMERAMNAIENTDERLAKARARSEELMLELQKIGAESRMILMRQNDRVEQEAFTRRVEQMKTRHAIINTAVFVAGVLISAAIFLLVKKLAA